MAAPRKVGLMANEIERSWELIADRFEIEPGAVKAPGVDLQAAHLLGWYAALMALLDVAMATGKPMQAVWQTAYARADQAVRDEVDARGGAWSEHYAAMDEPAGAELL